MAKATADGKVCNILINIGNGPYASVHIDNRHVCEVDHNSNYPWMVEISNITGVVKITDIGTGRGSKITLYGVTTSNVIDEYAVFLQLPGVSWTAFRGWPWDSSNSSSKFSGKTGLVRDIRKLLGYTPSPHTWVKAPFRFRYDYIGYIGSNLNNATIVNTHSTYTNASISIYTPLVVGGKRSNWSGSISVGSPRYTGRNIYVSGSFNGLEQGNSTHYIRLYVNGRVVATSTNGTSGTIGGNWRTNSPGTYRAELKVEGNGVNYTLSSTNFYVDYPPPTRPTMGSVSNTTPSSINTTRSKRLSASWGVSYVGYPSGTITYEWHCYSTTYGELASGTTTSTSHSFNWNMPAQNVRDNIYWTVRAKTSGNSLGYTGFVTSGNVEVFWAYTEPSRITAGSVSPNRFQLFNGNTNISYTANTNINNWGDRPGTRSVEYALSKNGSILRWYGRYNTSSTGLFSQSLSYSVPESDLNSTYNVIAYKRLDGVEYTTGSDPRWPTTGDNHVTAGNITFYEVIGRVSGSMSLNPTTIISGLSNRIDYNWTYDKQSSEKVSFYIEVYRMSTGRVTKTVNLEQNNTTSRSYSGFTESVLVEAQQADAYEIRLKATVTELLGNTHTYTLITLTPQVYNPPIGSLDLNNVSRPLPTNNANSSLAKQSTDITWDYNYSFQGVQITKVTLVIESNPFGREEIELPFDAITSPYYNNYTKINPGEYALGSTVKAYALIYYQVIGGTRTYSVQTNTVTINITPTRYLYFLARVGYGEEQLNKIHPLVNGRDETSEKIHID